MSRPFRLGSTSYVYPGDLIENARRLGPLVDDIELVLFDAGEHGCNIPTADEARELAHIAAEFALTYTVHLPMDVRPGNDSLEKAQRVIDSTRALNPFAVILHFDGEAIMGHPDPVTIANWQHEAREALETVLGWLNNRECLCVENLERWNPRLFDDIVAQAGVSRCIDIGHLWLEDIDPLPYLQAHLPKARVIHLHGIGERDHSSLALVPEAQVAAVMDELQQFGYTGVVTLEVFGEEDFRASLHALVTSRLYGLSL